MVESSLSSQMYSILQNYIVTKKEKGYIDYYTIFGFSKEDSIEKIKEMIESKKLTFLFQSRQIEAYQNLLGKEIGLAYAEICEWLPKMMQDFKSVGRKALYDLTLENNKKREFQSNFPPTLSKEEAELQSILEENLKFGLSHLFAVLQNIYCIKIDDIFFTKSAHSKKRAKHLGQETIRKIMESHLTKGPVDTYYIKQIVFDYMGYLMLNSDVLKDYIASFIETYLRTMQKAQAYGLPHYMLRALDEYTQTSYHGSFLKGNTITPTFHEYWSGQDLFLFIELYFNLKRDLYPDLSISHIQKQIDTGLLEKKELLKQFYESFAKKDGLSCKTYLLK